jgi:hypothetical protein
LICPCKKMKACRFSVAYLSTSWEIYIETQSDCSKIYVNFPF